MRSNYKKLKQNYPWINYKFIYILVVLTYLINIKIISIKFGATGLDLFITQNLVVLSFSCLYIFKFKAGTNYLFSSFFWSIVIIIVVTFISTSISSIFKIQSNEIEHIFIEFMKVFFSIFFIFTFINSVTLFIFSKARILKYKLLIINLITTYILLLLLNSYNIKLYDSLILEPYYWISKLFPINEKVLEIGANLLASNIYLPNEILKILLTATFMYIFWILSIIYTYLGINLIHILLITLKDYILIILPIKWVTRIKKINEIINKNKQKQENIESIQILEFETNGYYQEILHSIDPLYDKSSTKISVVGYFGTHGSGKTTSILKVLQEESIDYLHIELSKYNFSDFNELAYLIIVQILDSIKGKSNFDPIEFYRIRSGFKKFLVNTNFSANLNPFINLIPGLSLGFTHEERSLPDLNKLKDDFKFLFEDNNLNLLIVLDDIERMHDPKQIIQILSFISLFKSIRRMKFLIIYSKKHLKHVLKDITYDRNISKLLRKYLDKEFHHYGSGYLIRYIEYKLNDIFYLPTDSKSRENVQSDEVNKLFIKIKTNLINLISYKFASVHKWNWRKIENDLYYHTKFKIIISRHIEDLALDMCKHMNINLGNIDSDLNCNIKELRMLSELIVLIHSGGYSNYNIAIYQSIKTLDDIVDFLILDISKLNFMMERMSELDEKVLIIQILFIKSYGGFDHYSFPLVKYLKRNTDQFLKQLDYFLQTGIQIDRLNSKLIFDNIHNITNFLNRSLLSDYNLDYAIASNGFLRISLLILNIFSQKKIKVNWRVDIPYSFCNLIENISPLGINYASHDQIKQEIEMLIEKKLSENELVELEDLFALPLIKTQFTMNRLLLLNNFINILNNKINNNVLPKTID